MRIAIIGAGISGLMVAYRLVELGISDITIFESAPTIGGKIKSSIIDGRPYELGAVISTPDYEVISDLVRRFDLPRSFPDYTTYFDRNGNQINMLTRIEERYGRKKTVEALTNFWRLVQKTPATTTLTEFDGSYFRTMRDFSDSAAITPVTELIRPFLTGCGYGYYEDIAAIYLMKLAPWILKRGILDHLSFGLIANWYGLDGGWIKLCHALAKGLDIKTSSPVTSVQRSEDGVTLVAGGILYHADYLVLALDLKEAMTFLDATNIERALASEVQYISYLVTLVDAPGAITATFADAIYPETVGDVNYIVRPYRDSSICQVYQMLPKGVDLKQLRHNRAASIELAGGTCKEELYSQLWQYFPHVSCDALCRGYYHQFANQQGKNRTYYASSLLSFETLEHTASFAIDLGERIVGSGLKMPSTNFSIGALNDVKRIDFVSSSRF